MKTKKRKLDPRTEVPTCKSDIDKVYVVEYTKLHGTAEQRALIKKTILENMEDKVSQLTKEPYKSIKMGKVREVFCAEFFPQLNDKKNGKKTFIALLDEL